ncbi:hypothetical protein NMY22_g13425 [Coprinellus aureogranulatus]|nr:hypothetical protein NMY22_g13425 [Coprinellus aureogranulatus]
MEEAKIASDLTEAQVDHREFIGGGSSLDSPIKRVPPEILALIFLALLDPTDPHFPFHTYQIRTGISRKHSSVVVSHVCSGWRTLALRTPRLWSTIRFEVPCYSSLNEQPWRPGAAAYGTWLARVEAWRKNIQPWIARSAACPIDLTFDTHFTGTVERDVEPEYRTKVTQDCKAMVDLLCTSSDRWKALYCRFDDINFVTMTLAKLFHEPRWKFPALEKVWALVLHHEGHNRSLRIAERLIEGDLFGASSLREVRLEGKWADIAVTKLRPNTTIFDSVTRLALSTTNTRGEGFSTVQALSLLKALPGLTEVSFYLGREAVGSFPVTHPNLTSMTLDGRPVPKGFAVYLDLPNVTSLSLIGCQEVCPQAPAEEDDGYAELLLMLGPQLKELTLRHDLVSGPLLSRCIRQISSLITLRLRSVDGRFPSSDQADVFVLNVLSSPGICSQLSELSFTNLSNYREDGRSEKALVELICSRVSDRTKGPSGRSCLRRVHCGFCYSSKLDVRSELQNRGVDWNGVELKLNYPDRK